MIDISIGFDTDQFSKSRSEGERMATGTFFQNSQLAHENSNKAHKNVQKRSKTLNPNLHNVISTGTKIAKIRLSLYFMGCVRLAWYCG